MDKGITLDYSDDELEDIKTQIHQPSYDNSLKKILIEEQIKILQNPKENREFCKICNGELKSQIHARTHYISAKHKKNLELLRERLMCLPIETLQENIHKARFCIPDSAVVIEVVDSYCNVCNITLVGKFAQENHQDAEIHKRNLERYCDICHMRTISKEALVEHKSFSHHEKLRPVTDDDYVPEIPAIYVSPKMSPKKSPKVGTKNQTGLQQNATWNCDVCHETFVGERLYNNHKVVFTHIVLEQLKIQYPPEIIDAICSIKRGGLFCSLCDVKLLSLASTGSHLNCSKHVTRFEKLLQTVYTKGNVNLVAFCIPDSGVASSEAIEEVDSYCKVCNITLVGKLVMDGHQNAELHRRNLERYCDICRVRTISKEALAEHNFFSHKQELQQPNRNEDVPAIPSVQVSPTRTPKTSPKVERNTQSDLQENVTWNCDICHIMFEEEITFINHKEVFPHIVLEELKMQYRPEIVDAVCSITNGRIFCALCKAKVQSIVDTKFHLNCSRHVARFDRLLKNFLVKENIDNAGIDNSETEFIKETEKTYTESEVNIPNSETEEEVENKNLENHFFYCYLCKMEFDSKAKINVHAMDFPHVEVAKLKSQLISLGVSYAEYWILSKYYFSCTLCDAKINCEKVSEQHCSGPKHKQRLYRWCKEFSTWKCGPVVDPRYFLCKTCDVSLVGTTEAELHYTMKCHLEKMEYYCQPCTITNPTEDVVDDLDKSFEHQENISLDIDEPTTSKTSFDDWNKDQKENYNNKIPNAPKEKKSLTACSDDVSLEEQVYKELKKAMDTLYYSKSLPLDVSLKYAKKINKGICKLRRKYEKRAQNLSYVVESNNGSERLEPWASNEDLCKDEVKNQTIKVNTGGYVSSYLHDNPSVELDATYTLDCLYDNASVKPQQSIGNNSGVDVANTSDCLYDNASVKPQQSIGNNSGVDVANTSDCLHDNASVKFDISNLSICLNDKIDVSKKIPVAIEVESNKRAVKSNAKKKKKYTVENVQDVWSDRDYEPICKSVIKDDDVGPKITKKEIGENNWDDVVKPLDFKDMLEMISSRKNEYDNSWNHDNLEVELLNEFETLIKLIDSGDVPPEIILWHLHNCNRELQLAVDENKNTRTLHKNSRLQYIPFL